MPFNKETASKAVKKRWGERTPESNRTEQLNIRISPSEKQMLGDKAKKAGNLSNAETVVRALMQYDPESSEDSQD